MFLGVPELKCWDIDPHSHLIALERGVQNLELTYAIGKLWIVGIFAARADRGVESPENLLEGVVVAFAVASGKVGEAARSRFQQGRILNENLIPGGHSEGY